MRRPADDPCLNIDTWTMRPDTVRDLAARAGEGAELILGEGVMGLFDGAPDGTGSTADLARATRLAGGAGDRCGGHGGICRRPASRIPDPPTRGRAGRASCSTRVGSPGHARRLQAACAPLGAKLLGCVPKSPDLILPERHLGLVQASEHPDLDSFLDRAGQVVAENLDCEALAALRPAGPSAAGRWACPTATTGPAHRRGPRPRLRLQLSRGAGGLA